jgi:hypothetical protein
MEKEGCGVLGTGNDSFPDVWIVLRPKTGGDRWVVYIQSKRQVNVGERLILKTTILSEHSKCSFLPTHHFFVLVTDDKSGTEEGTLATNEIVVSSDLHKEFYKKCLSLCKANVV